MFYPGEDWTDVLIIISFRVVVYPGEEGTAVAELVLAGIGMADGFVWITAEWQGPTGELLTETNSVCVWCQPGFSLGQLVF